jgi:uncharacterized protein
MSDLYFTLSSEINAPVEALRDWHFRPGAFGRLNPPWEKARVISAPGALVDGARAIIEIQAGPIKQRWIADHEITPDGFIDRQTSGPFAFWEHRHHFESTGPTTSRLTDAITYRLPLGLPGRLFGGSLVRKKLERMFHYRHEVTRIDLERAVQYPPPRPLRILMTGATGMVGRPLCAYLETQGHEVYRVTRKATQPGEIEWDPEKERLELPAGVNYDAAIHLAGENVADARWSPEKKRRILESRRLGTRLFARTLAAMTQPPAVLISASGSGIYPPDGNIHGEDSPVGDHFLSRVCQVWEDETAPAKAAGMRVVLARIGVVLSPTGGALQKMAPVFLAGGGGPIGSGKQRLSWIAMDDVLDILHRATFETSWEGPINLTAPEPVTNREFANTLARVLRRPALFSVPAAAVRAVFGEMAEETLLADLAVVPERLFSLGYSFRYPDLETALRHVLGHPLP